ncbi:hypothetical protein DSM106972_068020 [Dulcicalothrix desertica PCC 7102]|uniref:DUF4276 domain-containing protein n=1 Tax=Dulcicalothrix desertica PCC 7102 TaxID=232991 RepID=A0A433V5B9_9CYAN|nr:DUF4276 family protein [Dulcicalothrix desertica]RUT01251.1 hypothetical protein DSM106972_068020 [Dulcicalothrix desertica PCC 7102]TWH40598.1 uncharacterized protein DUF4276 [Dulcicalothrix desertica PCC 7102]
MIRINVFVEGQTEETFVRELLYGYFQEKNIFLNPILVKTSSVSKGGVVSYAKIKPQLNKKCLEDRSAFVTTMFDLYTLPNDFPGKSSLPQTSDPFQKAEYLEQELSKDIGHKNFIPNLLVHEFEGLLYSKAQAFSEWFDASVVNTLEAERNAFPSPEHINDDPATAPSKRILRCCDGYEKPLHGSLIAIDIGLDTIRQQCQHFNQWLRRLENLSS